MTDFLNFNNWFFVYDQINEDMLYNFDEFFTTLENLHSYNTRTRKIILLSKHYLTPEPTVYTLSDIELSLNRAK